MRRGQLIPEKFSFSWHVVLFGGFNKKTPCMFIVKNCLVLHWSWRSDLEHVLWQNCWTGWKSENDAACHKLNAKFTCMTYLYFIWFLASSEEALVCKAGCQKGKPGPFKQCDWVFNGQNNIKVTRIQVCWVDPIYWIMFVPPEQV